MRNNDQNRIRNLVEGARNGNMPDLPTQQAPPPLNMQIQHAAVAVANMGAMEGLPSLGPQLDKWEAAMALAPPNEADRMVVACGRVLAEAQEALRAILKAQAPAATAEVEALPEAPAWAPKLVDDEPNGHAP